MTDRPPDLFRLLERSAARTPGAVAVEDPEGGRALTYRQLEAEARRVASALVEQGVIPGDRVAIAAPKSVDTVASIFGVLAVGGVYVPLDPSSPEERRDRILEDCSPRVVLNPHPNPLPPLHALPSGEGATSRPSVFDRGAYILYTSGSTGRPKGVLHTHASAMSLIDWAAEAFCPKPGDRFSSHAPFHFDLSILDLFLPIAHGATVVLIGEELGKDPRRLAPFIAEQGITHWYSTPSVLSLLAQYGRLDRYQYPTLRQVLFAGEVFPMPRLRALRELWPTPRWFNLYGPTETNVCTFYALPEDSWDDRDEPFPIGKACSGCQARVVDEDGVDVSPGERGELWVTGGSVMTEYWDRPERTSQAFEIDGDHRWYKTGDIVWQDDDGDYHFVGRRDRMVKRFGFRVELGEIEAALHRHPEIAEVAVVTIPDGGDGLGLRAFLHGSRTPPSVLDLKKFCAERLPAYMIPDAFVFGPPLPKTSTDKIDYQALERRAEPTPA